MGYDFEIQYKKGQSNKAADALSRVQSSEVTISVLSLSDDDLFNKIKTSWEEDNALQQIITELKNKTGKHNQFSWVQDQLRRKDKLVVGNNPTLRKEVLHWMHDSSLGGHSGRDSTVKRLKSVFWWKGLSKEVQNYIRNCSVCQKCKYDTAPSPGLLQPLPIPQRLWSSISMDFIDGLPKSKGKEVIFVVVDRLSKSAHFVPLAHPYTASLVAKAYVDNIYKLHALLDNIISDRDSVFISDFWSELFKIQGVDLFKSTSYHPQTDGQTEVVNRCLETYSRCFCHDKQPTWVDWIPLEEWWYNTTPHSATGLSPYELLYSKSPPIHLPYLPGESSNVLVDRTLQKREQVIKLLKFHLARAQNRMVQCATRHRADKSFEVGTYVYLKLQPNRQTSLATGRSQKLNQRYYGPFLIEEKVGEVAYRLTLPTNAKIHNVFHISQLKECKGFQHGRQDLPSNIFQDDINEPELIIARGLMKRNNIAKVQLLVKWKNKPLKDASWVLYEDFVKAYPNFNL